MWGKVRSGWSRDSRLFAAIWRCIASPPTAFLNTLLFLLVRNNSGMRNGAQLVCVNGEKADIGLQPMFQLEWTYSNLFQLPDHFRTDLKLEQVVEGIAPNCLLNTDRLEALATFSRRVVPLSDHLLSKIMLLNVHSEPPKRHLWTIPTHPITVNIPCHCWVGSTKNYLVTMQSILQWVNIWDRLVPRNPFWIKNSIV